MAAGFDRLRAGDTNGAVQVFQAAETDPWGRLGTSMAALAAGDVDRARSAMQEPFADPTLDAERRAQLAAIALTGGDIAGARQEIDTVLAVNPTALRPLVLLSSIELRQNRPADALIAAERALAAHPQSVGALIAASEAAQSQFDLETARGYLDRALAIDPRDVHALVNRARIRFGTDDTEGARADADRAAALAPDDAQVRSLRGFIRLADGNITGARADFESAARRDPEFGEPHLGLGLALFRDNRVEAGLEEMLLATLLEPKVALYQSYLGKAYYQARRFPEGLSALASAKRLDPRDPTPWLYASFFLRDQNEQVAALNELRHAIALNDHRAVYRSRLLLDRDLATKNVSLAQLYRQLGFEAWGAFEALNSLDTDLTNSSAHLFLAETYGGLTDRSEAQGSELLQFFLYAPVNRNSFNNFSEYTALIEQPRRQFDVTAELGSRDRRFINTAHRSGNERFAHVAFIQGARQGGSRLETDDQRVQGFFQGKLSLTKSADLFASYSGVRDEQGESEVTTRTFGTDLFNAVILRQFATPDPTIGYLFEQYEVTLGFKQQWRAGSVFTAAVRYQDTEQTITRPLTTVACNGLDVSQIPLFAQYGPRIARTNVNPHQLFDAQLQQATRVGRHQLILGYQRYTLDKAQNCSETFSFDLLTDTFPNRLDRDGQDQGAQAYVRDEIQLTRWLHASIGVAYQELAYTDIGSQTAVHDVEQWSPRLGLAVQLGPTMRLRAASYKQLHINLFGSNLAPPTVSGFVVARNEFPTASRLEHSVSLERSGSHVFFAVRAFTRDTEVPFLLDSEGNSFIPEADASGNGLGAYVNWIAHDRVTVFGENQLIRFGANSFDRWDNLVRLGVNLIHPRGLFVRVAGSHVTQRFANTRVPGLPRSGFSLTDVRLGYEFAGKRGLASVEVTNAFDQGFDAVVEGLSIDEFLPRRRALASLRWRLW